MLYREFIEGTGCRDNEKNYKVYKDLEIMYMNSNMSKSEIYEYGKKLVDNSKTEKELQIEAEINEQINTFKALIESNKSFINYHTEMVKIHKEFGDKEMEKDNRRMVRYFKNENRVLRDKIRFLKMA